MAIKLLNDSKLTLLGIQKKKEAMFSLFATDFDGSYWLNSRMQVFGISTLASIFYGTESSINLFRQSMGKTCFIMLNCVNYKQFYGSF